MAYQNLISLKANILGLMKISFNQLAKNDMKKSPGITLIELMVGILIIALIATVGLVALKNARAKARDARRIFDINQYAQALRIYAQENPEGTFPTEGGFLGANHLSAAINDQLRKYIPELPSDPQDDGGTTFNDNYYYYVAQNSCQGQIYPTVHVQNIESGNPDFYNNPCIAGLAEGNANSADYLIILY